MNVEGDFGRRMDSQHDDGDGEGGLCLAAVADVGGVVGDGAALGDVPGRGQAGEAGVRVVGPGLGVDAVGPEGDEQAVGEEADEGQEDVQDEHDALDEEDEHGEDGDDDVEVREAGAGEVWSVSFWVDLVR